MSYRICVDQLPMGRLQADVMQLVSEAFESIGKKYFVIGATARDVLGLMLHKVAIRKTADLDITVCIETWDDFEEILQALVLKGFRRSKKVKQRLYYGHESEDMTIDLVPFGGIAIPDDVFSWPGEPDTKLSVVGFESALKNTFEIDVEGRFSFFIPTAPGLFILKLVSWNDRSKRLVYKDAVDMDFLIRIYYEVWLENATREDLIPVYEMVTETEPDDYIWGASMIAVDVVNLADKSDLVVLNDILREELAKQEQSKLLQNCLPVDEEEGRFDVTSAGWSYIQSIFTKAIENK